MQLLDLTLPSPEENLALDESLLDWAETETEDEQRIGRRPQQKNCFGEVLRLWEPTTPFVVLGRGSHAHQEVHLSACEQLQIPVVRRSSGGAAVVVGPGCLLYAVVLSYELRPQLRPLDAAHRFVLARMSRAVAACAPGVTPAGTSDLVLSAGAVRGDSRGEAGGRKFSGNSLRCKRTHFLYHGTLLYNFDLGLIERCLRMPPREPHYRAGRPHTQFLANVPATCSELRQAVVQSWGAKVPLDDWPREQTMELVNSRYDSDSWTWSR